MLQIMTQMLYSGGFGGAGLGSMVKISWIMGQSERIACEVYSGTKSYALRTKITMPKPVTSENAKFKSKFRKKRKS